MLRSISSVEARSARQMELYGLVQADTAGTTARGTVAKEDTAQAVRKRLTEAQLSEGRMKPDTAEKGFGRYDVYLPPAEEGGVAEYSVERRTGSLVSKDAAGAQGASTPAFRQLSEGAARFRLKATIAASTLAELLLEKPFDEWLEVTDLKLNKIRAKATSRP